MESPKEEQSNTPARASIEYANIDTSKFATKTDLLKMQNQINDSRKTMAKLSTKIFNEEMNRESFVNEKLASAIGKLTISMDEMISVRKYVATA